MGKKNKAKKGRLNYNINKFIEHICVEQCGLCKPGNPELCYEMYRLNPRKFMKFGIQSIFEATSFVASLESNIYDCSDEEIQTIFQEFFCDGKLCRSTPNENCDELFCCLSAFHRQIKGNNTIVSYKNVAREDPVPFFFCNEGFVEEVEKLLNGDSDREQDKDKKAHAATQTIYSGEASNS